jgi:TatD family-associated radical SAM protein
MIKGLSYWLRGNLYIGVTNKVNTISAVAVRGPGFVMPKSSEFSKLYMEDQLYSPKPIEIDATPQMIFNVVDEAFNDGKIAVDSMDAAPITFAGYGEPLLGLDTMCDAAGLIKESRHGVRLRVKTNGLVATADCCNVASLLGSAGIEHVSINLMSHNPKQYSELMQPHKNLKFGDVCSFIIACAEAGLTVECTTVAHPSIDTAAVRALARSLGAHDFSVGTYHA